MKGARGVAPPMNWNCRMVKVPWGSVVVVSHKLGRMHWKSAVRRSTFVWWSQKIGSNAE